MGTYLYISPIHALLQLGGGTRSGYPFGQVWFAFLVSSSVCHAARAHRETRVVSQDAAQSLSTDTIRANSSLQHRVFRAGRTEIEAVIINLDRRPDRWEKISERLKKAGSSEHYELNFERFSAVDIKNTTVADTEVLHRWNTRRNAEFIQKKASREGYIDARSHTVQDIDFSEGERGCAASHVRAWRYLLDRGKNEPLLIMEDDAALSKNFWPTLEKGLRDLPPDADVFYLGWSQAANWRREITPEVVEAEYVWYLHGYLLYPKGAEILLSKLPVDQPVDNFVANLTASEDIAAYCIRPQIISQAEGWDVHSDIKHSDEDNSWVDKIMSVLLSLWDGAKGLR
jgi:GR25 family glycosyltransferase involved in LPS biosynthesis